LGYEREEIREETWMAAERSAVELECFLAERADHLLRTAVLLAGSREGGEDLLQTAVEARKPSPARGSRVFSPDSPAR
jgi:hypothetical protein